MNKILFCRILICSLISLFGCSVSAQTVGSLYKASVPVSSHSDQVRDQAFSEALSEVLVKVGGHDSVTELDAVKQNLGRAAAIVEQYHYQSVASGSNTRQWMLVVNFDPREVNKLLNGIGEGVWSDDRPQVIAWIAATSPEGERYLVSADPEEPIAKTLVSEFERRGVPLILPLLDLDDQQHTEVNDVWAPFPWVIEQASERYAADAELIGKLLPLRGDDSAVTWQATWLLLEDGTTQSFQTQGETAEQAVAAGVNALSDRLAARYLPVPSDSPPRNFSLAVYGVKGLKGYREASDYLNHLGLVANLSVKSIASDHVIFDISVTGGERLLLQTLATDKVLSPKEIEGQQFVANLTYQLAS